jgi:hypothetical protein
MAQPPEFWTFVASSVLVLLLGGAMTVLSYLAYRREDKRSLWVAGVGFGLVTTVGVIAAVYQLGIARTYELSGRELLSLQTVEGVVLLLGLLALIYSVVRS